MAQTRVSDLVNKGLTQAQFLKLYTKPALLFSTMEMDADQTTETDIRSITDTDLLSCNEQKETPTSKFTTSRIFFLEKTLRNSSPEIILGRDPSCDIIVSLPSVSKKHAYFTQDQNQWYVVDNKSTNGTNVDNASIKPYGRALLRDNSRIVFGYEAMARYFTPSGLWGVLCLYNGLNFLQVSVLDD